MDKKKILIVIAVIIAIFIIIALCKTSTFSKNPGEAIEKQISNMSPEEHEKFNKIFDEALRVKGEKCKPEQSNYFKIAEKIKVCNKFTSIPFNSFTYSYRMQGMVEDKCLIEKEKVTLGLKPNFDVIANCNIPRTTLDEMYKVFLEYTKKMCDENTKTSELNANLKKVEELILNHCENK